MRSDELLTAVRMSAFIGPGTSYTDFDDPRVLIELNDKLQTAFEDIVVKSRAGYWLHEYIYTTLANDADYRIPARSVVGGLEKVEIASVSTGPYTKLSEVPASAAQLYRSTQLGGPQTPYVFTVVGDLVEVIPAPPAGYFLKLTYYLRPSRLVTSQSSTQGGAAVVRGQVTAVNTTTRVVTVNALPFDYSLTSPAAITSATQTLDVVHPDGWHELSYVGATQTISGLNITFTDAQDMTDILVGDFVRVADQSDWPCLPDDFHRTLADLVAVKILIMLAMKDKADLLAENAGNDMLRFQNLLMPRVKAEPKSVPLMRRSRGYAYPWWRLS